MKKQMDKLKSKIKTSKKFTIFLFALALIGVVLGSFFITMLASSDKTLVKEYLDQYTGVIKTGKVNYFSIFLSSFLNSGLTFLAIWMLGISVVGIPIILFLFFCKAFTLGFSIGSILYVYKWKGMMLSFFYVFPHQVILLLAYGILMIYALSVSMKMIEAVAKKKSIDFRHIMEKYSIVLGISMLLLLITSFYETFAMQNVMKWVLSVIK